MLDPVPETDVLGANLASIIPEIGTLTPKDPPVF